MGPVWTGGSVTVSEAWRSLGAPLVRDQRLPPGRKPGMAPSTRTSRGRAMSSWNPYAYNPLNVDKTKTHMKPLECSRLVIKLPGRIRAYYVVRNTE